jgi:hypothetical protein
VHFDPEVAYNYGIAREETDRLWQESIDNKDDSLATAAASGMMFILNGSDGGECSSMLPSKFAVCTNKYCSMY